MAFTAKQERNGADMGGGEQNTALPGPSSQADIAAAKVQSESAAGVRGDEGAALLQSAQGAGVGGHPDIGGGGSMWEWDAGLAIGDIEGGGSG